MKRVLSSNERIVFCEQMAMILKSGLSVTEGLMMMKEDTEEQYPAQRELFETLEKRMEEKGMLHEVLEETGAFPDYMIHMIRIGEETGNLDEVMDGLAVYYEREEAIKQDIKSAVTYPLLMLAMMGIIVLVMVIKVLPVFAQVYEQLGGQMTGIAAVLLKAGAAIRTYYGWIILVAILAGTGALWLSGTDKGRKFMRNTSRHFFAIRRIMRQMSLARFASGLSMALRSGMNYEDAFQMLEMLLEEDAEMKKNMEACVDKINTGETLSRAAVEAGILTGLDARLVSIAEKTGETDRALNEVAARADDEVTGRIQNVISVLEPSLVAFLSVLVGGILLSVMVPLMGILSSIG